VKLSSNACTVLLMLLIGKPRLCTFGMLGLTVPGNGLASASEGTANTIVVEFHAEELTDSEVMTV
jgi:hypothetical protein